jgi:hypothetical protein
METPWKIAIKPPRSQILSVGVSRRPATTAINEVLDADHQATIEDARIAKTLGRNALIIDSLDDGGQSLGIKPQTPRPIRQMLRAHLPLLQALKLPHKVVTHLIC